MTITITANNKTITIEIPEIEGKDVKVTSPDPVPLPPEPPQKSQKWTCPENTGNQTWRYPKSRIVLFDSCDERALMRSDIGHFLMRYDWLVIPTDKSFNGFVCNAREIEELVEGASHITVTDAVGHLLITMRYPSGKIREYDLKMLNSDGLKMVRQMNREDPESWYLLWKSPKYSTCPRLAENFLAA